MKTVEATGIEKRQSVSLGKISAVNKSVRTCAVRELFRKRVGEKRNEERTDSR